MNATTTTIIAPMPSPGTAWKQGKTAGTWFRHIAFLGPCTAQDGKITALKFGVTVPAGTGWQEKMLAALPGRLVAFTFKNANQAQWISGTAFMPHGATGIPNCRAPENFRYTATSAHLNAAVTHKATGTWKQDDTQGMDRVILTAI
jgi:hypothetical protein